MTNSPFADLPKPFRPGNAKSNRTGWTFTFYDANDRRWRYELAEWPSSAEAVKQMRIFVATVGEVDMMRRFVELRYGKDAIPKED